MLGRNPYANQVNQYQTQKIMSAKPEELTLMLYEGAIKFCNIAEMAKEKGDDKKMTDYLLKVENIIDYLNNTLDMRFEVSKDFENVYKYLLKRLVEADLNHDDALEILKEVNKHLHTMKDAWAEAMKASKTTATA
ncbi:MAG: flagellar export chaperone FliS [Butyrivibrio sp.]|nr:flagellar export chaperone FliS [Butyrivibrio sp.]